MPSIQSRRDFLASLSAAGAAGVLGARRSLADEEAAGDDHGPPDHEPQAFASRPNIVAGSCCARTASPTSAIVPAMKGPPGAVMIGRGEADFTSTFAASVILPIDAGEPITALAGIHPGCYELFAHERVQTIVRSEGQDAWPYRRSAPARTSTSACMAKPMSGSIPQRDIEWVTGPGTPMELFAAGEVDAFLGFPPEPQELRAREIGQVILNTGDRPAVVAVLLLHAARQPRTSSATIRWRPSACCAPSSRPTDYLRRRAEPRRATAGRPRLRRPARLRAADPDEVPFSAWREYDPEDTLRFYALRLHEAGMITSSPTRSSPRAPTGASSTSSSAS